MIKALAPKQKAWLLAGAAALLAGGLALLPRMPQDLAYHDFADKTPLGPMPNWQNVVSNLPFLLVGISGLDVWRRRENGRLATQERAGWFCLFLGIALTGIGSAYYHWIPSNDTLVWDRLPMTLGFMGFFAAALGERVSHAAYRVALWPLVLIGVASVFYWHHTETQSAGDLRFYAFVQYAPLLLIPLMAYLYEPRWTDGEMVLVAIGWYLLAKALELADGRIFETLQVVGGHALKHSAAAVGCWILVAMFARRKPTGAFATLEFDR